MRKMFLVSQIFLLSFVSIFPQISPDGKNIINVYCEKNYFPVNSALAANKKSPYATLLIKYLSSFENDKTEFFFKDFDSFPELYRQRDRADIILALPSHIPDSFPNKKILTLPFIRFKKMILIQDTKSEVENLLDMTQPTYQTLFSAFEDLTNNKIDSIKCFAPALEILKNNEIQEKYFFEDTRYSLNLIINNENIPAPILNEWTEEENLAWIQEEWKRLFSGQYLSTGLNEIYLDIKEQDVLDQSGIQLITIPSDYNSALFHDPSRNDDFLDLYLNEIRNKTDLHLKTLSPRDLPDRIIESGIKISFPRAYILYGPDSQDAEQEELSKKIAYLKNSPVSINIEFPDYDDVKIEEFENLRLLIDNLTEKKIDYILFPFETNLPFILKDLITPQKVILDRESVIYLKTSNPEIKPILEKGIRNISSERIMTFYQDALNLDYSGTKSSNFLKELNPGENLWINKYPYIVFTDKYLFPPFFIREKSTNKGLLPDIIKELSKISGQHFIWNQDNEEKNERIGNFSPRLSIMLLPENKIERKNKQISLLNIKQVIITRKFNEEKYYSQETLKGRKVVILEEYLRHSSIHDLYPEHYEYINVSRVDEGFTMLKQGFADAFILDLVTASYYLNSFRNKNLVISGEFENSISLVAESNDMYLYTIGQKAIRAIGDDKFHRIYQKWIFSYANDSFRENRIIYVFLAIFTGSLLSFIIWAINMKVRINKISQSEMKLKSGQKELNEAREEAIESMRKASEANRSKTIFLTNMSHEIRTPMNSILGFADILLDSGVNEKQAEYISLIRSAARNLLTIINDILDLSKIEAGRLEINKKPVHLPELLNEILVFFSPTIKNAGLKFSVKIDKEIPPLLYLDEARIRQILINLMGNAVKFTEKGEIALEVQSHFYQQNNERIHLLFNVKDTGIGIPFDQQQKIFNMFEQQERQDASRYKGTGLGLAICRNLVEMMDGRISVESSPGEGSVFSVHLFHVKVAGKDENYEDQKNENLGVEPFSESWKILALDKSQSSIEKMKDYLQLLNINASFARNYEEWRAKVKNNKFDLLIINLKSILTFETAISNKIKFIIKKTGIPVIFMGEGTESKNIMTGIDNYIYLRKPVWIHILKQNIAHLLESLPAESGNTRKDQDSPTGISSPENIDLEKIINEIETVKSSGDFEMIEDFARHLKQYDNPPGSGFFSEYSQNLGESATSFDPEKTDRILKNLLLLLKGYKK